MQSYKVPISILSIVFILGTAATVLTMRSYTQQTQPISKDAREEKRRAFPVVDFDAPQPADKEVRAKREARSKRYDKYSGQQIQEAPLTSGRIFSSHWANDLSAIPVAESDVVLVGTVNNAEAYLSNDRTAIYSEFDTQIDEVLKNGTLSLPIGTIATIERFGGAVRFRSGSVLTYETAGQGMPLIGRKYLFFLKRISGDTQFRIVTGYEICGSTVSPLDGSAVEEGTRQYVFDQYKGYEVFAFLQKVREAVAQLR